MIDGWDVCWGLTEAIMLDNGHVKVDVLRLNGAWFPTVEGLRHYNIPKCRGMIMNNYEQPSKKWIQVIGNTQKNEISSSIPVILVTYVRIMC